MLPVDRMRRWLLRRTGAALVTLGIAVTLLFFIARLTPGDPLAGALDQPGMTPRARMILRQRYCLDCPLAGQYVAFVRGAVTGNLGVSIASQRPVTALIGERLPASLLLGGTVLFIDFTIGLLLGVIQASRKGGAADWSLGLLSLTGYATPSFLLGLGLAALFGTYGHLLPVAGMRDPTLGVDAGAAAHTLDVARHLLLPVLTLTLVSIGATMRFQRSALLDVLPQPFVLAARARGLPAHRVIWHAWRNALFPVVTLFGLWLPIVVAGSVFVEAVFAWPGLGSLAAEAVARRDYPLLMGIALLVATLVVFGGWLADVAYALLDPRVHHA